MAKHLKRKLTTFIAYWRELNAARYQLGLDYVGRDEAMGCYESGMSVYEAATHCGAT